MASVTVLTSVYGDYDEVRHQTAQLDELDDRLDVDWVCVSDRELELPRPWRSVTVGRRYEHPRMDAKRVKLTPWELADQFDVDDVVWIDANTRVTCPTFVSEALTYRHDGVAVWKHPNRQCIYEEAEASLRLCPEKYGDQPIVAQVERYRELGYPANNGLYACGVVAWCSTEQARSLGYSWFEECQRWSYQDQLSLPFVCWRLDVVPGVFPLRQIKTSTKLYNRWLRIEPHLRDD